MYNDVPLAIPEPAAAELEQSELQPWRTKILTSILYAMVLVGCIVLLITGSTVVQSLMATGESYDLSLMVIATITYLGMLIITLLRRIAFAIRAGAMLGLIYV